MPLRHWPLIAAFVAVAPVLPSNPAIAGFGRKPGSERPANSDRRILGGTLLGVRVMANSDRRQGGVSGIPRLAGVLLLLMLLWSAQAIGGEQRLLELAPEDLSQAGVNVLEHARILRDPEGRLDVGEVGVLAEAGSGFRRLSDQHLRKGFTNDVFWLSFELALSGADSRRLFLVAWPPFIDRVDLYTEVADGEWAVQPGGDHVPVERRAMAVPETVFPVVIGDEPVRFLLRVESSSVVSLSVLLKTEQVLAGEAAARWIRHGVFLGMILTATLIAALSAIWLRQAVFVLAAGYLFCFFGFQFLFNGNDQIFLYPDRPWLSDHLLGVFTCAAAGLMAWFVVSYLEPGRHFPRLTRFLRGLAVIMGVFSLVSLAGAYHWVAPAVLAVLLLILAVMLVLFVGMIRYARSRAVAMLVMFLPALAAALYQILHNVGWLGDSLLAVRFWDIAALSQMPFAAVAILIRVREVQKRLAREASYQLLVENQVDLVVKVDPDGRFEFASRSYCETFGKTPEQLIGQKFMPLVHDDDVEATMSAFRATLKPPYVSYVEQRALTVNGWRWLAWSDSAVLDGQGRPVAVIGVGRDVTDRVEAQSALGRSRQRLEMALDAARIGCYRVDLEASGIVADDRCVRLLGHDPATFTLDWQNWKRLLHPLDVERVSRLTEEHVLAAGESMEMEYRIRHRDGRWLWWLDRVAGAEADSAGEGRVMVGLVQDITERKLVEQQLEFLVRHDELTGLLNRRGIAEVGRHQFAQARRGGPPCSFAVADLDHFKRVNDTLGHDAGDRVLRHVADCMRRSMRAGDWVGRWGGEEFLLVLPQTRLGEGREALERIRRAIEAAPLEVDGQEVRMTISIGLATADPEDTGPDPVIARADGALYQAKRDGRNRVRTG